LQIYTECEASEVNIISENKDYKIITNELTFSACLSKDYFCKLKNSIIEWENEIVDDCPFSIVKSIQLETIGKELMNRKENKYSELLENITICNDIQAWKTAGGFYLTQNDEALSLQRATDEIKIIDNLILSEMDYHSINLLQTITTLTRQTNEKICQVNRTFMNMYKKMENEFFTFNDFNGNEAVLYTDKCQVFIPNCIQISKNEIIEKQKIVMKIFQN
jgi:hypothetical protein